MSDESQSELAAALKAQAKRLRLGDMLRAERKRRGWSAERTGKHFGLNQSSISRWEQGTNAPEEKNIPQVAEFLGISVQEVRALKYAMEEAPVTLSEVHLRQSLFESKFESLEKRIEGLEGQVAVMTQALMGLVHRIGSPEFISEASRED